jgi:penicillin-binding protein 1C
MGLCGIGVRLSDVVFYAGLARLGAAQPFIEREGQAAQRASRLLNPVTAWYVGNILIGAPPPDNAPAGRIAFKTGTSYGYRDAWPVGFDGRMTIGVWVGRPDGAPVPGLVGRAAAAPILFDAFARTGLTPAPLPHAPPSAVFSTTANLPPPLRRFSTGVAQTGAAPRIVFPPDGARLEFGGGAIRTRWP